MRTISTCASRTMRSEAQSLFDSAGDVTYAICALRTQNEGAEILIQLSAEHEGARETRTLVLTTEQYLELRPTRGEITEESYHALREASELCAAIRAGESLLAFRSNSVQLLAKKLMGKGYARSTALAAADALAQRGMINESRDLKREVERALKKLWGPRRITTYLWSRGFSKETLSALPSLLEGIDFTEGCTALLRKRFPTPPTDESERGRMVSFLSRYGYSVATIRASFSRAFSDGEA